MVESERLYIRKWRPDDAEALYRYASDGRVSEMALWPRHTSVEMSRQVINDYFMPNEFTFAMVLKATDEPVGCIGLVPDGGEHYPLLKEEHEVGYWIGHPYWGEGLTTEALKALIQFCRGTLKLRSLLITTDAANIASQRVAAKCGFRHIADYDSEGIPSKAFRLTLDPLAIRQIAEKEKNRFIDLLLIGDESEEMISRYFDAGTLYVGSAEGKDVAVIMTVEQPDGSVEVKNLAVVPAFRRRGVGRRMLEYIEQINAGKNNYSRHRRNALDIAIL